MGTTFESYSHYSNLTNVQMMTRKSMERSISEHALVYIDLNSEAIGKKGHEVPICWSAIAAGNPRHTAPRMDGRDPGDALRPLPVHLQPRADVELADHPNAGPTGTTTHDVQGGVRPRPRLFVADGIDAPWAYVMTWGSDQVGRRAAVPAAAGGLRCRSGPTSTTSATTRSIARRGPRSSRSSSGRRQYAPGKPVLVGEIGALTTCPERP